MNKLLDSLPQALLERIDKLANETGESVERIVEKGVELYEQKRAKKVRKTKAPVKNPRLAKLMEDPFKKAAYDEIMSGVRQVAHESVTPEQKTARAVAGGNGRSKSLTPERRREIGAARWGSKTEPKAEE